MVFRGEAQAPRGRSDKGAHTAKPGQNLTVITYGALVQKALLAATQVERRNPQVSVEIIDLRTLAPYDWQAIKTSITKTSRVIVAHEDVLSWGYGAEIAARIADELFSTLDAPVRRVAALDTWVGYHPQLEAAILPQTENLAEEMTRLLSSATATLPPAPDAHAESAR